MRSFFTWTYDLLLKGGAAIAGFLIGIWHGENRSALLLVCLMTADYISGIAAAVLLKSDKTKNGGLSSAAGWRGLLRKALILIVVALAYLLDRFMNDGSAMFSTATIWFYISNEGLSFVENLARCGVPVPARLKRLLEKAGDETDPPPGSNRKPLS